MSDQNLESPKPEHENNPSPTEAKKHAQQAPKVNPVPDRIAGLPETPPAPACSEKPREEGQNWRKNLELSIAAFGLLALIVYTIFSILQWAQIRWTNRLTREALNGSNYQLQETLKKMQLQADATNNLYKEAQNQTKQAETVAKNSHTQAAAAAESVRIARQQFSEAMRPRVVVSDMVIHSIGSGDTNNIVGGSPIVIDIHYKSIGKTTALRLTIHRHVLLGKAMDQFRPDPPQLSGTSALEADESQFTSAASVIDTYSQSFNRGGSVCLNRFR